MRIYYARFPDGTDDFYTTVRGVKFPEGTTLCVQITDRDGTLITGYDIPVVGGKAQINGRGKRQAKIHYGYERSERTPKIHIGTKERENES